jgi:hypothetical protein
MEMGGGLRRLPFTGVWDCYFPWNGREDWHVRTTAQESLGAILQGCAL